jgi:hypothetical protein
MGVEMKLKFDDAPKAIWLIVCDDMDCKESFEMHKVNCNVPWCEDPINTDDVEYIRADVAEAERNELLAALKTSAEALWHYSANARAREADAIIEKIERQS